MYSYTDVRPPPNKNSACSTPLRRLATKIPKPSSLRCTPSVIMNCRLSPSNWRWRTTTPPLDRTKRAILALMFLRARSTASESLAPYQTTLGTISDHTMMTCWKNPGMRSKSALIKVSNSSIRMLQMSLPPACSTSMTGPLAALPISTAADRTCCQRKPLIPRHTTSR